MARRRKCRRGVLHLYEQHPCGGEVLPRWCDVVLRCLASCASRGSMCRWGEMLGEQEAKEDLERAMNACVVVLLVMRVIVFLRVTGASLCIGL